ncbi:unnamed protein product, partial [Effrenium voratum]
VIAAILTVTPKARLSELVLAKAILEFYDAQKLAPSGISQQALAKWASRMAYGARKVCQKFKRLVYVTSPAAVPGCLEVFDPWAVLKQKIEALKTQPAQPVHAQPRQQALKPEKGPRTGSPGRHSVPEHVLSALSKLSCSLPPAEPVSTAPEGKRKAKSPAKPAVPKAATKPPAKKAAQKQKKSAAAKLKADEDLEKQLGLAAAGEAVYKPKEFQQLKSAFVSRRRSAGNTFAEATKAWMLSSERALFLTTLSEKELKRRRFA